MQTALLLIAHGSRLPEANDDLHGLAKRLLAQGSYPIVVASFLEIAKPSIPEGAKRAVELGAKRIVMLPYFLSGGRHVRQDLTNYQAQLTKAFPAIEFILAEALGPHSLLDQLVLVRAHEAEHQGSVQHKA